MTIPHALQTLLTTEGDISFAEFMQQALYSPQFGYYQSHRPKLGAQGDFITAPELTPLFAQTLAEQCLPILRDIPNAVIFEFGAGSGRLAVELLKHLENKQQLPQYYYILEVSAGLRESQQTLIQQTIPHLAARVQWLTQWPKQPISGVILANEVLDAMPVHRFLREAEGIFESMIGLNPTTGELHERFVPCNNTLLAEYVTRHIPSDWAPYQSEVNLFIDGWLKQCADMLHQGVMILIDYGFPRSEYYHPDRNQGTLMCHAQHLTHPNPLINVGEQDITAHVDFSHVAEAAITAGFHLSGYTNQAAFLLGAGITQLLERMEDNAVKVNAIQALKQLLQPHEMGELFKVIALNKNYPHTMSGFSLQDKRHSL